MKKQHGVVERTKTINAGVQKGTGFYPSNSTKKRNKPA